MPQWYQQGCVDVIQLDERLTLDDVGEAQQLFSNASRERLPQIVVDLRRLRLVDSAGLELLCDVNSTCVERGGTLRLAAVSNLIRDVLYVCGLDSQFAQHPDIISAVGAFAL